jgi:outer membrane lipoprotein-sorting protein
MRMKRWGKGVSLLLLLAALAPGRAQTTGDPLAEIRESHARVRDLVAQVSRKEVREDELKRMKRNAATALEFSRIKVYFMAPDRLRLEGKYGLVPVTMIENGDVKLYKFGLGVNRRRNVAGESGKKQGGLEFGLLAGEVWDDYNITVVDREPWDNRPAIVLDLMAKGDPKGSHHRIWVDAENYRLLRRDRLAGDGKLKHRHLFRQPYRSPAGTWLSKRIEIYNQYNKFVGALELTDIEVNQGLAESLFRT